jgi:hypothetical protein
MMPLVAFRSPRRASRPVKRGVTSARHTWSVGDLDEAIERSAAPAATRRAFERLVDTQPGSAKLLDSDPELAATAVAVTGASRRLSLVLETDPGAVSILAELDRRPPLAGETPDELAR